MHVWQRLGEEVQRFFGPLVVVLLAAFYRFSICHKVRFMRSH